MRSRKQEDREQDEQGMAQHRLSCHVCGRTVEPEECSWQEDDDAQICCRECRAEMESCGCSD